MNLPFFCKLILVLSSFSIGMHAGASESGFFVGSGINFSNFKDGDGGGQNAKGQGIDLRAGYQFGSFLKLIVGYGNSKIGSGDVFGADHTLKTRFVKIRPQWQFDSGFLVYAELGAIKGSINILRPFVRNYDDKGFMGGIGLGYKTSQHEIAIGLEESQIDDELLIKGLVFQYYYHF